MQLFSILAVPLGFIMRWIYNFLGSYGWTIIIFTLLTRVVLFPLTMKQQKSTARMSAYQPMIQEIQKKWANDKNRQNAEMQKFYEENNISMSAGCLPMMVNMLVLFGIIAVIQAPLTHLLQVPETQVNAGVALVQYYDPDSDIGSGNASYTRQSQLMGAVIAGPERFTEGAEVPTVDGEIYILGDGETYKDGKIYDKDGKVKNENAPAEFVNLSNDVVGRISEFNYSFLGLNLAAAPTTSNWVTLIMPILSLITMVASQLIIMATSPTQQGKGQMILMTVLFGVMFGFFAFRVPAGFSLYYTISNVFMTIQQPIVKKIYDPEKIREEVEQEIAERKAAKKARKKVTVKTEDGDVIDKELNESELVKLKLAKARELDAERYGGVKEEDSAKAQAAAEKKLAAAEGADEADDDKADDTEADAKGGDEPKADGDDAAKKAGRRKRATKKKTEDKEESFAEKEMKAEAATTAEAATKAEAAPVADEAEEAAEAEAEKEEETDA